LHPQLAVPVELVEGDGPQQAAFSVGAQQVVCSFGEQHEETGAAFAALPLKKRVRFSGTSSLAGGAASGDADLLIIDSFPSGIYWTLKLASSSRDGGGAKKTQLWS
jgi:hypothetical protein